MEMPGDNGQPSTGASGAPLASTTRLPPLYYGPGGGVVDGFPCGLSSLTGLPNESPSFFLPPHHLHLSHHYPLPSSSSSPFTHRPGAPPTFNDHTLFGQQAMPMLTSHTHLASPNRIMSNESLRNHNLQFIPETPPTLTNYSHRLFPHHQSPPTNQLSHALNHRQCQPANLFRTVAMTTPSLVGQSTSSGNGDGMSVLSWERETQEGATPGLLSQSSSDSAANGVRNSPGKRRFASTEEQYSSESYSPLAPNRTIFKAPRLEDCGRSALHAPVIRGSFQNAHDSIPHSGETIGTRGTQDSRILSDTLLQPPSLISSSSSSGNPARDDVNSDVARVSFNLRLPRYSGGATPTSNVASSNQTASMLPGATGGKRQNESVLFGDHETGGIGTFTLFEHPSLSVDLPQSMPTITSSSATAAPTSCDQTVPHHCTSSSSVVAPATQTRGRGFSLSVEISGSSDRVDSIDLNLDTSSECAVTSSSIPYNPPFSPPPPPPPPPISVSSTLSLSPSPPHPASSPPAANGLRSEPGTSGLGREEIINVDSSDDEDDHHVIMFTREPDNRRLGNTTRRRDATQMSQDERVARHLQAQFDRELDVSAVTHPSSSSSSSHRRLFGELRGQRRSQADSNLWSSRGTSNYRALASHIHHITPSDAHRLLQVASHSGHAPSVGGAFSGHTSSVGGARRRPLQLRSSPTVIFNAIMGSHTSYEELLELAERLGPAQPRGLSRDEISRLPSRTHRKKDGDDKSCVVCMSEFQMREKIRTLRPCRHDFHQKCIDRWLKEHNTCPICRETVTTISS
ncbi:RING finger protein 44 [Geodia barretti]|uniref:RING finger protein 44 n=1 Tax=Geodia barretti TaxID=519541 RepID=A0AA35RIM3_GEOBA|nr:RING finger protein 44 [Geodia barretti]